MNPRSLALRDALADGWLIGAVGVGAAALGVVAVLSPLAAIGLVVAVIFIAVTLHDLALGVCLFTVLSFFEQFPGLENTTFGPPKIAGVVLVMAWLLASTDGERRMPMLLRDRPVLAYAAIAFVVWATASRLWADDPGVATSNAFRLALSVVPVFIVYSAIREPRHLRWMIAAYLVGAAASAIVGLAGTSPEGGTPNAGESRLAGGIADPNELAAVLVPALVLALFWLAVARGVVARWTLGLASALFASALFLTESRGGLVAMAVVMVAGLALAGPWRPKVLVVASIVTALGVSYYTLVAPPESLTRLTEFFTGGGTGRTDLWAIATQVIGDHPLVGVAAGNFQVVEPTYASSTLNISSVEFVVDTPKVVHNTYLEIWAELGLIGLVAFASLLGGSLVLAKRGLGDVVRSGDATTEALSRGLIVGVVGILAAFMFISGQYEKQFWLFLGLLTALHTIGRTAAQARAPGPSP